MNLTKTHLEIIKFIIVGGINTIDYYIVYLFLLKILGLNYLISHLTLNGLLNNSILIFSIKINTQCSSLLY